MSMDELVETSENHLRNQISQRFFSDGNGLANLATVSDYADKVVVEDIIINNIAIKE